MGKHYEVRDDKSNEKKALVMVSAWAEQQGLVLGQRKVDGKSNEIAAIPKLLKVLYLKGASEYKQKEEGHNRQETRFYRSLTNLTTPLNSQKKWRELKSLVMAEYMRVESNGKTSIERRYYISSLSLSAREFSHIIRGHWSIENQLHWVLDVAFHEDDSRIRLM